MRRIAAAFLMALSLISVSAADRPQDKAMTAQQLQATAAQQPTTDFLLFLPRDYEAKSSEKWPLLLFLHGAGERGTNVWLADVHGPSKYILNHPEFPFIMISPICGATDVWSTERMFALLDHAQKTWRVDEHRIYLTGLSMGGFATWDMALEHPEKFAAVIPVAGGADALPIILARSGFWPAAKTRALKTLPIWAFHGGKDPTVPTAESERPVKALQDMGASEVKLTIYPDAPHDSWNRTYANPEIYDWLLQHHR